MESRILYSDCQSPLRSYRMRSRSSFCQRSMKRSAQHGIVATSARLAWRGWRAGSLRLLLRRKCRIAPESAVEVARHARMASSAQRGAVVCLALVGQNRKFLFHHPVDVQDTLRAIALRRSIPRSRQSSRASASRSGAGLPAGTSQMPLCRARAPSPFRRFHKLIRSNATAAVLVIALIVASPYPWIPLCATGCGRAWHRRQNRHARNGAGYAVAMAREGDIGRVTVQARCREHMDPINRYALGLRNGGGDSHDRGGRNLSGRTPTDRPASSCTAMCLSSTASTTPRNRRRPSPRSFFKNMTRSLGEVARSPPI